MHVCKLKSLGRAHCGNHRSFPSFLPPSLFLSLFFPVLKSAGFAVSARLLVRGDCWLPRVPVFYSPSCLRTAYANASLNFRNTAARKARGYANAFYNRAGWSHRSFRRETLYLAVLSFKRNDSPFFTLFFFSRRKYKVWSLVKQQRGNVIGKRSRVPPA